MCCNTYDETQQEVKILKIDDQGGKAERCHTITGIGSISFLEHEGNYLYVLSRNASEEFKLLQYDSNNWEAPPKELCLPGCVFQFLIGPNEIVFSIENSEKKIPSSGY